MRIFRKVFLLIGILFIESFSLYAGSSSFLRSPAVSGSFYPSDPQELSQMLDEFLSEAQDADDTLSLTPRLLIVPHAGYKYSGKIAAKAYRLLQEKTYSVAILMGPSHHVRCEGICLWPQGSWETPLGIVPVDQGLAKRIQKEFFQDRKKPNPGAFFKAHEKEHSLEVQIPFLQKVLPRVPIVPILVNDTEAAKHLGAILHNVLPKDALMIISTDMSHYLSAKECEDKDADTRHLILNQDVGALEDTLHRDDNRMCGSVAVIAGLTWLNLEKGKLYPVAFGHSGQSTRENDRVVGYFAAAGNHEPEENSQEIPESVISPDDEKMLLKLSRQTLEGAFNNQKQQKEREQIPLMQEFKGAFITLRKKNGDLRGCIGNITPIKFLGESIPELTLSSAFHDSRFSPVRKEEVPDLTIDISILSDSKPIADPKDIQLGHHGVTLKLGKSQSVFLPEVATEQGWNLQDLLENLCLKAGLKKSCYKNKDARFSVFTSHHFGESALSGE